MKKLSFQLFLLKAILLLMSFILVLVGFFWSSISSSGMQRFLLIFGILMFLLIILWNWCQNREQIEFANEICETLDALMDHREPENFRPYEDSQVYKVQGKLLQYYEQMQEGQRQSHQDKQMIQELVSDISHQVKTPIANIQMFTDLMKQHQMTEEKRAEFLHTMEIQINKLDFLMQSLIKMSRLETGTFQMNMEENNLYDTIALAINGIWEMADRKEIQINVDCDNCFMIKHDRKWTVEALGNLLDNAVKYTPEGGKVEITVRPWQFYTRIDISDTGIGIASEHYHEIFKRFYRVQEVAAVSGVGLGLYLARTIITQQRGYISVKSKLGEGTTFSVFLLT